ncbi:HIT domain-containing protein [Streptomyces sp. NPDC001455]|uniref:HIT family protein n=1 Tax=unclassified Streptomyces TaxID=2593676 RepID=UPI00331D5B4B
MPWRARSGFTPRAQNHVAFLDRWPNVRGKVLVAPKAHIEHVVRDLDEVACLRLIQVVRELALAVEGVCGSERTYLYSLTVLYDAVQAWQARLASAPAVDELVAFGYDGTAFVDMAELRSRKRGSGYAGKFVVTRCHSFPD